MSSTSSTPSTSSTRKDTMAAYAQARVIPYLPQGESHLPEIIPIDFSDLYPSVILPFAYPGEADTTQGNYSQ